MACLKPADCKLFELSFHMSCQCPDELPGSNPVPPTQDTREHERGHAKTHEDRDTASMHPKAPSRPSLCSFRNIMQTDLRFTELIYFIDFNTSGCSFQGISWLPIYEYLDRSMLASAK